MISYCDDLHDALVISFIYNITDNKPGLNLAGHCGDTFDGFILRCPKIGEDIKECQKKGKAIILSIGGANGNYSLPDANAGSAFAQTVWDMFLGGNSTTRPFGDAIIDGIDLDLEGKNDTQIAGFAGYTTFVDELRKKFPTPTNSTTQTRSYYITSAPQCPFPDASLNSTLNAAWFDMVFVQFYNNPNCAPGLDFNFGTWNNWATKTSINKGVRVYLGVPGGEGAAGTGVLNPQQLESAINIAKTNPSFGGVMMWSAGHARLSKLDEAAAKILHGPTPTTGSSAPSPVTALPIAGPNGAIPTITVKASPGKPAMMAVKLVKGQPKPSPTASMRGVRVGGNAIESSQVDSDPVAVAVAGGQLYSLPQMDLQSHAEGASFVIHAMCK